MLILHATWLYTSLGDKTRGLVVWAETDRTQDMSTRALPRLHPFSASSRAVRRILDEWMPSAEFLIKRSADAFTANLWLPSNETAPQASSPLLKLESSDAALLPRLASGRTEHSFY